MAAVQYEVGEDPVENLATALRMIEAAAAKGAQVVVLPEFDNHVSWYADRDHARRLAETLDGPFVTALSEAAAVHAIHLMANCTLRRDDGRVSGSNILFGPDGGILAVSDKQVLMGSERAHLDGAVDRVGVVDTAVGRLGLYSCMDGVIFETPRTLAVEGAQVLLNSLNSFALDEASLHVPVRAVENKVWVVAANKVGPLIPDHSIEAVAKQVGVPIDRLHGAGESQIVAPDGTVVAIAPRTGAAVVVADIDVSLADDKTRPDGTDVIGSRRPEAYRPLAEPPKGRRAGPGAEQMTATVLTGDTADLPGLLARAIAAGSDLIVLPELAAHPGGDANAPADPALLPDVLASRLGGTATRVVTSVMDESRGHLGVVVAAAGVELVQPRLHGVSTSSTAGDGSTAEVTDVAVLVTPWGRLAVVVGDDALYPETFRLAALADADVVAVPFTVRAATDTSLLLLERAAENRVNLAVASRPHPEHGGGVLIPLSSDFTLWGDWEGRSFAGVISRPEPVPAEGGVTTAVLHPAQATNRMVSRGTDLVDGRPWELLDALVR